MLLKKEYFLVVFALIMTFSNAVRTKRMYALCPPKFIRIGNECYYISKNKVSWLDAHFECKDRNSRLAEPIKFEDRALRKYFMKSDSDQNEKWIGCIYNWEQHKWQWGYNGRDLSYQSFSQMIPGQDLRFNCAVLNPNLKYRWSARSCVDKHTFVCQHRMPYVNANNRQKIYDRWNATYPNQVANEIEILVAEGGNSRKNQTRRSRPERININPSRRNHFRDNEITDNSIQESRMNKINRKRKHHYVRKQDQPQNDGRLLPNRTFTEYGIHGYPIVETVPDYTRITIRNNSLTDGQITQRRRSKGKRKNRLRSTTTVAPTTTSEQPNPEINDTYDKIDRIKELQRAHIIEKERIEQENLRLAEEKRREDEHRMAEEKRRLQEELRQQAQRKFEESERVRLAQEEEIKNKIKLQEQKDNHEQMLKEKEEQERKFEERRLREEQMKKDEDQLRREEEQLRKNEELKLKEINRRIEEERLFREREEKRLEEEQRIEEEKNILKNKKINDDKPIIETPKVVEPVKILNEIEEKRLRREKLKERLRNLSPEKQQEFFNRRNLRNKKHEKENEINESVIPEN